MSQKTIKGPEIVELEMTAGKTGQKFTANQIIVVEGVRYRVVVNAQLDRDGNGTVPCYKL